MSLKFLKEYNTFEYEKGDVTTDEADGTIMVKGILQRADALNQNGRIYPRDILARELENYKKIVQEDRAFGCLDHEDSPIVNFRTTSHIIRDIWMDNNTVYGKVQVIDTPCGNIIKAIIKAGGKPGISSRAVGSVKKQGEADVVQDDLQIICWDFVSEPSTHGAFMHLTEARDLRPDELKALREQQTRSERIDRVLNDILSLRTPR